MLNTFCPPPELNSNLYERGRNVTTRRKSFKKKRKRTGIHYTFISLHSSVQAYEVMDGNNNHLDGTNTAGENLPFTIVIASISLIKVQRKKC